MRVHSYKGDLEKVSKHLDWPEPKVRAAVNYAPAFPEEIEQAIADNEAVDLQALQRMLPQARALVSDKIAGR